MNILLVVVFSVFAGDSISNMRGLSLARTTRNTFQLLKPIPVNFFSKNQNYSSSETAPKEEIEGLVKKSKVVVFMKGVPEEPSCGFSNAVVQILRMHGVQFDAYDVLDKNPLRQGVKDYTGWPTIPQIFINGEFIGGCDILLKMHQTGELIKTLAQVGIQSKATGKPEEVKAK